VNKTHVDKVNRKPRGSPLTDVVRFFFYPAIATKSVLSTLVTFHHHISYATSKFIAKKAEPPFFTAYSIVFFLAPNTMNGQVAPRAGLGKSTSVDFAVAKEKVYIGVYNCLVVLEKSVADKARWHGAAKVS
jgi:hypothetical protein